MISGVELWNQFVAAGVREAHRLEEILAGLPIADAPGSREPLGEAAALAFSIAAQSLLMGDERVGRLALAAERLLDAVLGGEVIPETALPYLVSATHTLAQAFDALANPDKSGARVEGLPLEGARYELETLTPAPGKTPAAAPAHVPVTRLKKAEPGSGSESGPGSGSGSESGSGSVWSPTVDDDMVELFFAEVNERLEGLAVKLVETESRPEDAELLRDVFRDLHTIKGSSAMVGLKPMNDIAHAAEDLMGQVQGGQRRLDRAIIDAILAALDELRGIAARALRREALSVPADLIRRLRDPSSAAASPAPVAEVAAATEATAGAPGAAGALQQAKATIRVDFDKLDHLLNLVGELVLGRDSLRGSITSLSALGGELSTDRQLARRIEILSDMRQQRVVAGGPARRSGPRPGAANAIGELREELGRVERVLADIAHELDHSSGRLDAVSGELRQAVMRLRMVPVGGVLRKHHRTVRDLANKLGKKARVVLAGEDTELDKLLVESLDEPLLHLVRNAVDHAIEPPDERIRAGKPPEGTVTIRAHQRGNQVVIEVEDDGKGISPELVRRKAREKDLVSPEELDAMDDRDVLDLIFRPGFSTAQVVSDVSGRGVGMDVVRQTIVHRLKGSIDIRSRVGQGSTFTLRLPLTLAITQVLLARAGGEVFAVPLDSVVRTLMVHGDEVRLVQDREVLTVRDRQVPLVRLADVLELPVEVGGATGELCVILTDQGGDLFGLVCEGLLGKKEIVIKSLGELLRGVPCSAGATLLADRCAIILDVAAVVERALSSRRAGRRATPDAEDGQRNPAAPGAAHILLVEDSDMIRESLRRLLADAGYRVTIARDGAEGLELAQAQRFDLVSTDVMMPRMDGYELTRALRDTAEYRDVPIVMVTSRGERIDRVRGFDAGVDEYITKPHDRHLLLKAVARLLAERGGAS